MLTCHRSVRADVPHPPLRGDAARAVPAGKARRHDPHLHRAGGERGRRDRPPRARARRRLREPPLPRPLPRVHRRPVRPALRGDGQGDRRVRRQGRQPAPLHGNFYSNGVQGSIVPVATGIALAEKLRGDGAVTHRVPRRRHARPGRRLRVPQHGLALAAAGAVRRREQPLRPDHAVELAVAGRSPPAREAFGIETAELDTTDVPRSTRPRARGGDGCARPASRSSSCSTPTASARTARATTFATRPRSTSGARATR